MWFIFLHSINIKEMFCQISWRFTKKSKSGNETLLILKLIENIWGSSFSFLCLLLKVMLCMNSNKINLPSLFSVYFKNKGIQCFFLGWNQANFSYFFLFSLSLKYRKNCLQGSEPSPTWERSCWRWTTWTRLSKFTRNSWHLLSRSMIR